jgi:hypothetical protein
MTAGDAPIINIPSWMPPSIHSRALELYRQSLGAFQGKPAAMIKRLICDERMNAVWTKLRDEGGEEFFVELFSVAVMLMRHPILMQPSSPSYVELAARLRDDARAIKKRQPHKTNRARLNALMEANELAVTASALRGGLISIEAAVAHLDELGLISTHASSSAEAA